MNTNTPDPGNDAELDAALKAWAVPPLSSPFKVRVTRALVQQTQRPADSHPGLWPWLLPLSLPWSPLRLAGASLAAAALGGVLSFTVPIANVAADDIGSFAAAYTYPYDPAAALSDDAVDLVAELW